ncbi:hypothetical protein EKO27_g9239 [Xylaria grammica]|uniref:Ubiquitin-related modifier 1 n=1 Tax=Xylaria grammica TaxID=363999 RepID=A0A439CUQ5_9PEZI|nr:hypothetical protein EKO27_g9239 [Xylaria grammica]
MATTTEVTVTDSPSKNADADADADAPTLSLMVEFTGGLEMLFSDQRRHALSIPARDKNNKPVTVAYLIEYLCEKTMEDARKELFVLDDHL